MLRGEERTRDLLAELIRGTVDDTVRRQMRRRAQEPSITSKIADALETQLNGFEINGYVVTVVSQEFPDRGPSSLEKQTGADLYIGIRVDSPWQPSPIAKGMLIQAKKVRPIGEVHMRGFEADQPASKGQLFLLEQCEKMRQRSQNGSFVWVYGPDGTGVVPVSEVLNQRIYAPERLASRDVGQQFRDILDCFSGDPGLIDIDIFEDEGALGGYLREIAVQRGVAINVAWPEE